MHNKRKLNSIVTDLSIICRKLNISVAFITQSNFKVPKDIRLNTTLFFIIKVLNKLALEQTAYNQWSDIDFKDFMNLYKKFSTKPHYFLVIDVILASDNHLYLRKNFLERK